MKKRGQVSVFVAVGIVIALVIGFAVYYSSSLRSASLVSQSSEVASLPGDLQDAGKDVEDCISYAAESALVDVGAAGGFVNPNLGVDTFAFGNGYVAFLYDKGKSNVPGLSDLEDELEDVLKISIANCTSVVSGVSVDASPVKDVGAVIDDGLVSFVVDWPVTFSKGDVSSKISRFRVEVPVGLKVMHGMVGEFVGESLSSGEIVCISCVVSSGIRNGIGVDLSFDDNVTVYRLTDFNSEVEGQPYSFYFASR